MRTARVSNNPSFRMNKNCGIMPPEKNIVKRMRIVNGVPPGSVRFASVYAAQKTNTNVEIVPKTVRIIEFTYATPMLPYQKNASLYAAVLQLPFHNLKPRELASCIGLNESRMSDQNG